MICREVTAAALLTLGMMAEPAIELRAPGNALELAIEAVELPAPGNALELAIEAIELPAPGNALELAMEAVELPAPGNALELAIEAVGVRLVRSDNLKAFGEAALRAAEESSDRTAKGRPVTGPNEGLGKDSEGLGREPWEERRAEALAAAPPAGSAERQGATVERLRSRAAGPATLPALPRSELAGFDVLAGAVAEERGDSARSEPGELKRTEGAGAGEDLGAFRETEGGGATWLRGGAARKAPLEGALGAGGARALPREGRGGETRGTLTEGARGAGAEDRGTEMDGAEKERLGAERGAGAEKPLERPPKPPEKPERADPPPENERPEGAEKDRPPPEMPPRAAEEDRFPASRKGGAISKQLESHRTPGRMLRLVMFKLP
ncbi:MAG: hypothetical protein HY717_11295 [Planctomycetes bacterium]|nr:hypothetical protein [Planctomycetota bacterium]